MVISGYDGKIKRCFIAKYQNFVSYRKGFEGRVHQLSQDYHLNKIDFHNGDTVVDCGANVGDLKLYFDLNNYEIEYIAIEPLLKSKNVLRKMFIHQRL